MKGYEQPGSDLGHFLLKQDLEAHIETVHGGRKQYWKKISDHERMAKVRELDTLNNRTSVNSNRKGSGENK